MTPGRIVLLTARREIVEKLRTRAFRVSTAILVLAVVAIAVGVGLSGGDDGLKTYEVGAVGTQAEATAGAAREAEGPAGLQIEVRELDSAEAARAAVADDEVAVALLDGELVTAGDPPEDLSALLQAAARVQRGTEALRGSGLSPAEVAAALAPPPLRVSDVGGDDSGEGLAFVGSLLLYIVIFTFGYLVASSVVEEKSSRVVEVVLSAIRPVHLLAGKVLGIGVLGLAQLALVVAAGLVAASLVGDLDLPSSTAPTAVLIAAFFVLGYAFYAAAFAVAGASVSRQEDTQSTTSPMLVLLVGGYLLSTSAIQDPDGTLARVLTFVPPVAPLVVPGRAAQDELGAGELALSVVLMLVATAALLLLAARVYERAVLRMGAPLKLTEALKLARG